MLTVSILINGRPVHTRSVVNRLDELGAYVCDDGTLIEHDPADGAVALAIKALRTIHEVAPRRAGNVRAGECGTSVPADNNTWPGRKPQVSGGGSGI